MNVLISCEVGGERVPTPLVASSAIDAIPFHRFPTSSQRCERPRVERPRVETKNGRAKQRSRDGFALPGQLPPKLPCGDPAAKHIAATMARQLGSPLISNDYAFGLIDVTRSLRHRQLFPPMTRAWPEADRRRLIELVYQPYRTQLLAAIRTMMVRSAAVIHLAVRTFELRSKGKLRRADLGLAYEPARDDEVDFCLDWIDEMYEGAPMLRVRRNYPRRGTVDCITKAMRSEFADQNYIGIEVLLNRAWADRAVPLRDEAIEGICSSLRSIATIDQRQVA